MTTRKAALVEQALIDKGMQQDENHHHMYRKTIDGVTTLVTRMSHGKAEVDDALGKLMANQCCLQLQEFWNLVDCPMDEEEWDAKVQERCSEGRNPFLGR